MPSGLVIKQGNFGFTITFTIQNADGSAKNLTGDTVTLEVWTTGTNPTLVFSHPCTITNALQGVVTYQVQPTDFTTIGEYYADLLLTSTGYDEETETFTISVIPSAP